MNLSLCSGSFWHPPCLAAVGSSAPLQALRDIPPCAWTPWGPLRGFQPPGSVGWGTGSTPFAFCGVSWSHPAPLLVGPPDLLQLPRHEGGRGGRRERRTEGRQDRRKEGQGERGMEKRKEKRKDEGKEGWREGRRGRGNAGQTDRRQDRQGGSSPAALGVPGGGRCWGLAASAGAAPAATAWPNG